MFKTIFSVNDDNVVLGLSIRPKSAVLRKNEIEVPNEIHQQAQVALASGFYEVKYVDNELVLNIVMELYKEDTRSFILDMRQRPVSIAYAGEEITTEETVGTYTEETEYVDIYSGRPIIHTMKQKQELIGLMHKAKQEMLTETAKMVVKLEQNLTIEQVTEMRESLLCRN